MYPDIVHGWAIAEQHLSEAAFLWSRLEQLFRSPRHDLAETAEQEQRLLAHLDGLVVGGAPVATRLLKPAVAEEDLPLAAAAAAALLAQYDQTSAVLDLLPNGTELQHQAVRQALERCEHEDLPALLTSLPAELPDTARAAVLEAQATRGLDAGPSLPKWCQSETPELAAAALRAARSAPTRVEPRMIRQRMDSPEPAVRDAALELGLRLGLRSAWRACQQLVARKEPGHRRAMELLALGGELADVDALLALTRVPRLRADAVWALGFSGRVSVANAALKWMRDEDHLFARLAAEAFSAITGLRLEGPYLRAEPEEDEEIPPLEEDLDADLGLKPEAGLRLANPDTVEAWWKQARSRFEPQARYLRGQPFGAESLLAALAQEPMRRRHLLALELALRSRGSLRLETQAPIRQQYLWLRQPRAPREVDLRVPLKQLLPLE